MNDIVEQLERGLSGPIPTGVESPSFQGGEDGCDSLDIRLTVLELDGVKLSLEVFNRRLRPS